MFFNSPFSDATTLIQVRLLLLSFHVFCVSGLMRCGKIILCGGFWTLVGAIRLLSGAESPTLGIQQSCVPRCVRAEVKDRRNRAKMAPRRDTNVRPLNVVSLVTAWLMVHSLLSSESDEPTRRDKYRGPWPTFCSLAIIVWNRLCLVYYLCKSLHWSRSFFNPLL